MKYLVYTFYFLLFLSFLVVFGIWGALLLSVGKIIPSIIGSLLGTTCILRAEYHLKPT